MEKRPNYNNDMRMEKRPNHNNGMYMGKRPNYDNGIHMRTINDERLRRLERTKIIKTAIVISLATGAVLGTLLGFNLGKNSVQPNIPLLPRNYIMVDVTVDINVGDTIYDITEEYYNDNYGGIYPTKTIYENSVMSKNHLKNSNIDYNDQLTIPIIIREDDETYTRMQFLAHQISEIEKNERWVDHVVEFGDTLSYLASLSSGSYNEAYNNMNEIMNMNGISNENVLDEGDVIKIINPKLGKLKLELNELKVELAEKAKNNSEKIM